MKALYFITLITLFNSHVHSSEFQSGDVIVISLKCYICPVIEDEGNGPFSHSGIILKRKNKIMVAQALGPVHVVPLKTFLKQKRKEGKVAVYRSYDLENSNVPENRFISVYKKFKNIKFDNDFSWDDEKLYCSEFVVKFLNRILGFESIRVKKMSFKKNYSIWKKYFKNKVPEGEKGYSPNDFIFDKNFYRIK